MDSGLGPESDGERIALEAGEVRGATLVAGLLARRWVVPIV